MLFYVLFKVSCVVALNIIIARTAREDLGRLVDTVKVVVDYSHCV